MGSFSIWHLLILLAIILLIFGGRGKIPKLMSDLGQGATAFKKGLNQRAILLRNALTLRTRRLKTRTVSITEKVRLRAALRR